MDSTGRPASAFARWLYTPWWHPRKWWPLAWLVLGLSAATGLGLWVAALIVNGDVRDAFASFVIWLAVSAILLVLVLAVASRMRGIGRVYIPSRRAARLWVVAVPLTVMSAPLVNITPVFTGLAAIEVALVVVALVLRIKDRRRRMTAYGERRPDPWT